MPAKPQHSFAVLRADFLLTFRMALPLIIAEVGWMSMGIVDTVMVGRLPNSAVAIGATGLGQSLYHSVAIFGGGLLLGLDTFVSHAFGREDLDDARHSLANGLFLAFALTPILMVAVSFWPAMMTRFGISAELVEPMRPFLWALNCGTLPLLAYFALRRYLQAVNVSNPIMFAMVSANIVNAIGDWALIYGHLGFRSMGIEGSGWSTCFARIYMAGVLVVTLLWVESKRNRTLSNWAGAVRIDLDRVWALLKLGGPAATQILLEVGAFGAATAVIAKLGPVPLSGHEIALNCAALTFMVPLGISSAAAVRVGQQLGRKDPEGARRAGWSAITLGVSFMTFSGMVFVSVPTLIARLFSPDPLSNPNRSKAIAGCGGVSALRWPADGCNRSVAWRWRYQNPHDRQLRCLLVDWASRGICLVFQTWLGSAGSLDWAVQRIDDNRFGAPIHLASAQACPHNLIEGGGG